MADKDAADVVRPLDYNIDDFLVPLREPRGDAHQLVDVSCELDRRVFRAQLEVEDVLWIVTWTCCPLGVLEEVRELRLQPSIRLVDGPGEENPKGCEIAGERHRSG